MDIDDRLRELTSRQHGLASRHQLRQLGMTDDSLRWRVGEGELEPTGNRVLRLGGSARTPAQVAMAGVLDAGRAALSHTSAAAWWEIPGFQLEPLQVTRLRGGRVQGSNLATIHQPRALIDDHLAVVDGIPTTTPARTLFDLAGTCHPMRVERALDSALAKRIVTHRSLALTLGQLAKRGRPGITLMRELIAARGEGYRPPESGLEHRFQQIVREHGLPAMRRQVDVGENSWLGRVDFMAEDLPLVVQIDSERYHGALLDAEADAKQTRALEAAGFTVLRFTDVDVWHRPQLVAARVREARRSLRHPVLAANPGVHTP